MDRINEWILTDRRINRVLRNDSSVEGKPDDQN